MIGTCSNKVKSKKQYKVLISLVLFRKLMRYHALDAPSCHVKHNNRSRNEETKTRHKYLMESFMSTDISIVLNRIDRKSQATKYNARVLASRLWLYASVDGGGGNGNTWTWMWKLSENNKLNFVRVQCVAQSIDEFEWDARALLAKRHENEENVYFSYRSPWQQIKFNSIFVPLYIPM